LLQRAAPVVRYQQIDRITVLFYSVNVLLLFIDFFDKLTYKITQLISNACLSYL